MDGRTLRHLVLSMAMLVGLAQAGHAVVPAGFSDTVITNVGTPTALTFTPDGRMLITNQGGTLWVWAGTLLPTPALTLSTCPGSERGLLGVTRLLGGVGGGVVGGVGGAVVGRRAGVGGLVAAAGRQAGPQHEHEGG